MIGGKGLTTLAAWIAKRHKEYKKFLGRIQRMIAAVTKAEKEERIQARKVQKIVCGYDPTKWIESSNHIRDINQESSTFTKLKLPPKVVGKHKYSKWRQQYHDIHAFLAQREWAPTVEGNGKGGTTWLGIFILFDTSEARNKKGQHHKNDDAHKRAKARSSKLKKNKDEGERCTAEVRPTLNEEISRFKAIARYILKHDLDEREARWFTMETRSQHRRLADLGVYGHQPAIAAYIKMSGEEKQRIIEAIAQQKVGANPKSQKAIRELKERQKKGDPDEKVRTRIARVALGTTIRWRRTVNDHEAEVNLKDDEEKQAPEYTTRLISCNKCGESQETKKMQLRTAVGYRGLYCKKCGTQDRCAWNKCQCQKIWHQCEIHRVDPAIHASRRGTTKKKQVDKKADCSIRLSSQRKAPTIKVTSRSKIGHTTGSGKEERRHIAIKASRQPPKPELIAKIRKKMQNSATKDEDELSTFDKTGVGKHSEEERIVKANAKLKPSEKPIEKDFSQPTTRLELKRRLNACIMNHRIQNDKYEVKLSMGSKVGKSISATKHLVRHAGAKVSSSKRTSEAIARLLRVT